MSNRRDFLKKAGGLALLTIVPRSVLGGTKFVAPSDQLTKGIIGVDVHADLPEVCRVLGENHLKKVPVLEDGIIVGVINRSDITHFSMEKYLEERGA